MAKWCFKGCGPDLVLPASQVQATSYMYQLAYLQWLVEQLKKQVDNLDPEAIADLEHQIQDLQTEVEAKSVVAANPTLAGTEANLEGIEIDGVKYKVPEGGGGGGDQTSGVFGVLVGSTTVSGGVYVIDGGLLYLHMPDLSAAAAEANVTQIALTSIPMTFPAVENDKVSLIATALGEDTGNIHTLQGVVSSAAGAFMIDDLEAAMFGYNGSWSFTSTTTGVAYYLQYFFPRMLVFKVKLV